MNETAADKLTEKQRIFCEVYCRCWNATKAALQAGYSEKTAHTTGWENLRKPEIQAYINEIKANAAEFAGVSLLRNAQELAKIAYSSAADLRKAWDSLKDWDDISEEAKASIQEVTTVSRVIKSVGGNEDEGDSRVVQTLDTVKVKQYSKITAIAELNKMFGFNAAEKIEITDAQISFDDSDTSEE